MMMWHNDPCKFHVANRHDREIRWWVRESKEGQELGEEGINNLFYSKYIQRKKRLDAFWDKMKAQEDRRGQCEQYGQVFEEETLVFVEEYDREEEGGGGGGGGGGGRGRGRGGRFFFC